MACNDSREKFPSGLFAGLCLRRDHLVPPGQLAGIGGADADLIGSGSADLADPGDAKFCFAVPTAFHLDELTWSRQIGATVEASAVFADVHGVGSLREGISVAIVATNKHAQCLRSARAAAGFSPEGCDWILKRQAHLRTAQGERLAENDANFQFFLREFVNDKKSVAEIDRSSKTNQCTAGVEHEGGGWFVERAGFAPTVNDDGYVE